MVKPSGFTLQSEPNKQRHQARKGNTMYYLVLKSWGQKRTDGLSSADPIEVLITDNKNGYIVLRELDAKSYVEAQNMVKFSKRKHDNTTSI